MNSKIKLKVAVAVVDRVAPRWQIAVIAAVGGVAGVEVTVIRLPNPEKRQPVEALARRLDHIDYRLTRHLTSVADPVQKGFIENPIRTANFRKAYFDLVIDLAGNIPRTRSLFPLRGVWSLAFGLHFRPHDQFPCFEEVLQGAEVTASTLIEHGKAGPEIIREAFTAVDPHSIFVTRAQALWAAPQLVAAALRDLSTGRRPPARPLPAPEKSSAALTVSAGCTFKYAKSALGHALKSLCFRDEWRVHYQSGAGEKAAHRKEGQDYSELDLADFSLLPALKGGFLADPFAAGRDGRTAIFCEEYPYAARRGIISSIEFRDGAPLYPPMPVLVRPYHLSYPFLIEEGGELYMIPESSANGTVDLYKCRSFPGVWELEATLLKGLKAVDTTVARMGDRLWMFTAVKRPETRNFDELHLYSAGRLAGPWAPHPGNPVRFDVRDCRPAGAPFRQGGHWIRPAQDGTIRYGRRVIFQRITKLSLTEYSEERIGFLDPGQIPGVEGVHTFNQGGGLTLFDSVRRVGKFRLDRLWMNNN